MGHTHTLTRIDRRASKGHMQRRRSIREDDVSEWMMMMMSWRRRGRKAGGETQHSRFISSFASRETDILFGGSDFSPCNPFPWTEDAGGVPGRFRCRCDVTAQRSSRAVKFLSHSSRPVCLSSFARRNIVARSVELLFTLRYGTGSHSILLNACDLAERMGTGTRRYTRISLIVRSHFETQSASRSHRPRQRDRYTPSPLILPYIHGHTRPR